MGLLRLELEDRRLQVSSGIESPLRGRDVLVIVFFGVIHPETGGEDME